MARTLTVESLSVGGVMSIYVFYQPIDVTCFHSRILPYIFDGSDLTDVLATANNPLEAIALLEPLRDAYDCILRGVKYDDPERGPVNPVHFLISCCVSSTLEFCRHLYPSWCVKAITSIELLPEDFPVLDHYQMPTALFDPILARFPDLAQQLQTIAHCQDMGGLVQAQSVPSVRDAIQAEFNKMYRNPIEPYFYDAAQALLEALIHAEEHELSFTEAIT
jgi:hypothetical protein